jgi:hypothetical protein
MKNSIKKIIDLKKENKSDHQASISENLQATAAALCRIAAVYLPIFIK